MFCARCGEEVVLFNGNGRAYPARLDVLEKRRACAEVLREEEVDNESPLKITLVQSVSSGERMDFTLQKSVELGVIAIQPVISERCVVRLSGERADKRWRAGRKLWCLPANKAAGIWCRRCGRCCLTARL